MNPKYESWLSADGTTLTVPEGTTSIGSWAFWGCAGLTAVTLPAGLASIGSCAFAGCARARFTAPPGKFAVMTSRGWLAHNFGWELVVGCEKHELSWWEEEGNREELRRKHELGAKEKKELEGLVEQAKKLKGMK